uniref:Uncharacterized protein n=1 Tax=Romanomermis culicivorax TaxID=13658 RepID=A0A915K0S5_ROMCU
MAVQTKQRRYQSKDEKGMIEASSSSSSSQQSSRSGSMSSDDKPFLKKLRNNEDTEVNVESTIPAKQSFLIDDILSDNRRINDDDDEICREAECADDETMTQYRRYVQNWRNNFSSQLLLLMAQ